MTVFRRFLPVIQCALALSAGSFVSTLAVAQQIPGPPIVTPDGASRTDDEDSNGLTVNFEVESQSSFSEDFSLSCGHTGDVDDCSVQSSVTISAYDTEVVQVTYSTGDPGSGTVTLTATGSGGNDDGYYSITVEEAEPEEPPANWDLTPFNNDNQRCADACAGLVLTHSTVPYFTLDTPRNVTLVYNSERAPALPLVQLDVQKPAEESCSPNEIRFAVEEVGAGNLAFVNGETTLRFTPQTTTRIGGRLDSGLTTGMYDIELIVTFYYSGGGCPGSIEQSWQTKLLVVDETSSPIARGWTVAGVQRLYLQSDSSALITQGDGSAVFFQKEGASWVSPAGEPSTLYKNGGSGFKRLYPDSTDVRFNTAGRMTTVYDPDNNATTFSYDGSNRLSYINDPKSKKIYFKYNANGLDSIYAAVGSPYRATQYTVDGSNVLTEIIQASTVADTTFFTYNGSLELVSMTDPSGGTTEYQYYSTTGELEEIWAPPVTVFATGLDTAVTRFNPWVRRVAPSTSTSGTKWTAPSATAVWDTVTVPGGAKTLTRVNRFGDPVEIDVPLTFDTDISYNDHGSPVKIVRSDGWGTDSIAYDTENRPIWVRLHNSGTTPRQFKYGPFSKVDSAWGGTEPTEDYFINSSTGRIDSVKVGLTAMTRYLYNSRGQVTRVTNGEGDILSKVGYTSAMWNVAADTAPGLRITTYGYDGYGRVTSVAPPGSATRTITYDVLNRTTDVDDGVNPNDTETDYYRDSIQVTDPKGQTYTQRVNKLGWTTSSDDPLGDTHGYQYDIDGFLRRWTNRRNSNIDYAYDAVGRLLTVAGDTMSYTSVGKVVTAENAYVTETMKLNERGQPDTITTYFELLDETYTLAFTYNSNGVLTKIVPSGTAGSFMTRDYSFHTARGALEWIKLNGEQTDYGFAADLFLDEIGLPGSNDVDVTRTSSNDMVGTDASAGYGSSTDRQSGYDMANRIEQYVLPGASEGHRYTYDGLGRLIQDTSITFTGSCGYTETTGYDCGSYSYDSHETFEYDAANNRIWVGTM